MEAWWQIFFTNYSKLSHVYQCPKSEKVHGTFGLGWKYKGHTVSSKLTSIIDGLLPFCHSWASEQFSRWKTSKQWKGIGKQRLYWLQCNRCHNKCHFSLVLCGLWSKNISSWASDLCLYYGPVKKDTCVLNYRVQVTLN